MKELVDLLIDVAKQQIKKERESGMTESTISLLATIAKLAIYL